MLETIRLQNGTIMAQCAKIESLEQALNDSRRRYIKVAKEFEDVSEEWKEECARIKKERDQYLTLFLQLCKTVHRDPAEIVEHYHAEQKDA